MTASETLGKIKSCDGSSLQKVYTETYPTTVLEFQREQTGRIHSTQKPLALMEYLVKTYTNVGQVVLDSSMGSGTTGVACKKLGRDFIGMELDAEMFRKASERIGATETALEAIAS